jgi:peptidoglycan L-alanyl-D-glutamate endopeptidase CwlK
MKYKFSKTSLKRMEKLEPTLQEILHKALEISEQDFSVISGYRTAEEQNELYKKGLSEADGYKIKSSHQTGLAVDIAPYIKGKGICWNINKCPLAWLHVVRAMKRASWLLRDKLIKNGFESQIFWGGAWNIGNSWDTPHFQLIRRTNNT